MIGRDLSGISQKEFEKQQKISDVDKWLASEQAGRDLCGTMSWCNYCVKAEAYPCAKAKFREKMDAALDEIVDEIIEKEDETKVLSAADTAQRTQQPVCEIAKDEIIEKTLAMQTRKAPEGYEYVVRFRRTFASRFVQSELLQDLYTEIKNAILSFGGIKSRLCNASENFRIGRKKIAKLAVSGKKLCLYLALPPQESEIGKYRAEDVSDKKAHRETPLRVKITGSRSLKRATELLNRLAETYGLARVGCIYTDFHCPFKTDEVLIEEGLVRPYTVLVRKK